MIVYIQSYVHCEKLGIKPCDSIIKTVIDTEKPRTILTHIEGQTFSLKDNVKFDAPKCFHFDSLDEDAEPIVINAKNLECAKLLFQNKRAHPLRFMRFFA